ncbi:MAG: ATP-binding protein [Nitrospira sp.]
MPIEPTAPTKVAILGAGRGGTALLDLLHQIRTIDVVGIADRDPRAPGLQRARELRIPVLDPATDLIAHQDVHLIMDVTGDPDMEHTLRTHVSPNVEVLSGPASRILWELVQHEACLQAELLHAEKLAGIGSFAAGIAHDINNPLQLILGLAENLADETDLDAIHEQAKEIAEAVKRTTAICRDLTSYSRRASPHHDSLVDVNAKLDDALKIARYAVAFHDVTVVKSYAPGATVTGNPDELLHVFVNLITNAVQAMERGGTLTIGSVSTPEGVHVRVSDTGCGIPSELLEQIFEPFFTTKPPGKGTGLGLYNIKHVVHHMHGTIGVESQPGVGSTFTITFPPTVPG